MLIQEFAEGCCDECGQTRKGVRFSFYESGAFLCWEHFRLAAPALRGPEPDVIRETVIRREGPCRCPCTCSRYTCGETFGVSDAGRSWSKYKTLSDTLAEGRSRSDSVSRQEGSS